MADYLNFCPLKKFVSNKHSENVLSNGPLASFTIGWSCSEHAYKAPEVASSLTDKSLQIDGTAIHFWIFTSMVKEEEISRLLNQAKGCGLHDSDILDVINEYFTADSEGKTNFLDFRPPVIDLFNSPRPQLGSKLPNFFQSTFESDSWFYSYTISETDFQLFQYFRLQPMYACIIHYHVCVRDSAVANPQFPTFFSSNCVFSLIMQIQREMLHRPYIPNPFSPLNPTGANICPNRNPCFRDIPK